MSAIIFPDDFENGFDKIPMPQGRESELQDVIDDVEETYLPKLFGVELYELFMADLVGGVPVTPRFQTVFNPLLFQDETSTQNPIYQSYGIKSMLMEFVYFLYVRDKATELSNTGGSIVVNSENSQRAGRLVHGIFERYNKGVDSYCTIQRYMNDEDPNTYPEYSGVLIDYAVRF